MSRVSQRVTAWALTSALLLGGAGLAVATGSASSAEVRVRPDVVKISNFMFKPSIIKVAPGATIKVTNYDSVDHTLTAVNHAFNTRDIAPRQTKSFRAPKKPGIYHYICSIHQFMMGTIIVK